MRKIHMENQVYKYKIGKQHIKIYLPNGKAIAPSYSDVTGRNWTDIERDSYDRCFSIRPKHIREYLQKLLPTLN